jgi:hypothetical protein
MSNGSKPSIFGAKSKEAPSPRSYPFGTITPVYEQADPKTGKRITVRGKTEIGHVHEITPEEFWGKNKPTTSAAARSRRRKAFAGY